jgi:glycosyltransferase domain-containing protein
VTAGISVLVPTKNRSDFLARLMRYYEGLAFQGCICIGDSSDAEHLDRTRLAIKALQGKLNIMYREYPGLNNAQCIQRLLGLAPAPYAVLLPDDDLLVPAALDQCAAFLDGHPEYNAAHGKAVLVRLKSKGVYGKVASVENYRLPVIEGENASQRLLDHLGDYAVTLFAVHRVASWRKMYQDVDTLKDATFALELLPGCLSAVQGKMKEINCLYLMRQTHVQRYYLPGTKDWMSGPEWQSSYESFREYLARELALLDKVGMEQARQTVGQAFAKYLDRLVPGRPSGRNGLYLMRRAAGIVPGVSAAWGALQSKTFRRTAEAPLLKELIQPSSPYHRDFMPIYRALTTAPADTDFNR